MKNKIGIGVITCNREKSFEKCINSIPAVDTIVVINDGMPYSKEYYPSKVKEVIQHNKNKCVGISKNEALRYLIQDDCDHLFLVEDDMLITNPDICTAYIKAAEESGIWHLNFGYHGPANFKPNQYGVKNPRQVVEYKNGIEIALNPNCVGAFSYFYKGIIKTVGYYDERFHNAWEHVEHTYRIIKLGLHPPFWWFADIANSDEYIKEQATPDESSAIRKTPEWTQGMQDGMLWYKQKHGWIPTHTPDTSPDQVMKILEEIETKYARKVL
jgi:glycosyltransferase involved in cell wall biosynthesis